MKHRISNFSEISMALKVEAGEKERQQTKLDAENKHIAKLLAHDS